MKDKDLESRVIGDLSFSKSYQQFIEQHNQMLLKITEKAQESPVYKNRIKKIDDINKLNELPLTPFEYINKCIKEFGLENVLLVPHELYWQTSGHTGESKKFYYSKKDLEEITNMGNEIAYVSGCKHGDILWNLGAGLPYVSGSLGTIIGKKFGMREIMTNLVSQSDFIKGLRKASKEEKIDFMSGVPLVYINIAQIVNNPKVFEQKVQEKISEKLGFFKFLSRPITKIYLRGINYEKLRENLKKVKITYSFAEPVKPYSRNIKSSFPNSKIREVYGSTELVFGAIQLSDNSDLSVMLNWFIPEIAPPEEIMKAKQDPSYKVNAVPWHKWKKGMKGELIVTRPGECLPLIRYPTGDLIEIVNPSEANHLKINNKKLTITLPTIKVLGRSSELVDFSTPEEMSIFMGAKLYSRQIKEAVASASKYGKVKWWDLYVTPPGNEPFTKIRFEIIPENKIENESKFKEEIKMLLRKECDELDVILRKIEENFPKEVMDKCLEINILDPDAYKRVEKQTEERLKQGRPLGQIKPKQIHIIKPEGNKNEKQN
jgi:phenylacetate-coenzyme A ligase PaaK-like adenylate-forming protein